jgi:predicted PhzF superfamily epimerase YddE/YHI9
MPTPETLKAAAPQLIRCMHGVDPEHAGEGGLAYVHWLEDAVPEQLSATAEAMLAEQAPREHASVFVAGGAGRYVAETYSPDGTRIRFCGHGALAAAWLALNEHEPDAGSVAFMNKNHDWQARRSSDADADIVLSYSSPTPVACAVPDFAEACLGAAPVAAAEVGAPTDYLILELDSVQTVQDLQPDFAAINVATERALIVTAAKMHTEMPGCVVFRYFAPQYGTPEDAATGSAAAQLAAYWLPRLNTQYCNAQQLSPQGAWMQLHQQGDTVELGARVGYG